MKNIFWKKCHTLYLLYIGIRIIGTVIGRYEKFHIGILLVSVDKKIEFIGLYQYRPIWKKAYRLYTVCHSTINRSLNFFGHIDIWVCVKMFNNDFMSSLSNKYMLKLGPSPSFKNIIPSQFSLCKQFFSTSWPPSSGNFFRINYNNYFLATVINLICASTVLNCTTIGSVYLQY